MADVLLSLHDSPAHIGQLEAWETDLEAFDKLKADYEDEQRRVRTDAYQVATLYGVFQSVIFTAIAQASRLTCQLWWCPVSLSAAVSIATFLAIAHKLHSIGELQEAIIETGLNIGAVVEQLDRVKRGGSKIDLQTTQPVQAPLQRKKFAGFRNIASREGIFALLFLTCFSVLIAAFSIKTLCRCPNCAQQANTTMARPPLFSTSTSIRAAPM